MNRDDEIQELRSVISQLEREALLHHEKLRQLKFRLDALEKQDIEGGVSPSGKKGIFRQPWAPREDEKLNLEHFIGLRLMHLVGIVVLVIGISIGVKFAVDRELISEAARIALAYTAGIILYFLSVRLKKKFELFSAILFSGAMASGYFTSYAAYVYYQLFSFPVVFILMVAITIFTAWAAIRYNRQEIAVLGMIGAYGIPFLISANADNVQLFFAYILLINGGIAFLSFKKNWKGMITVGILVTWTLYNGWALLRYEHPQQTEALLFLLAFYFLFSVAALAYQLLKKKLLQQVDVQHFVYNQVFAFVAMLIILTEGRFGGRSADVTGWGFLYFAAITLLSGYVMPAERLLLKYLAALSVLCLVCFAGIKWNGLPVTMLWLGIAAGLFVAGVVTRMAWLRLMAMILLGVTLLKLLIIDRSYFNTVQKVISYVAIGVLLLLLSFFYQRFRQTKA
jgi:uncharacterized membrane protein